MIFLFIFHWWSVKWLHFVIHAHGNSLFPVISLLSPSYLWFWRSVLIFSVAVSTLRFYLTLQYSELVKKWRFVLPLWKFTYCKEKLKWKFRDSCWESPSLSQIHISECKWARNKFEGTCLMNAICSTLGDESGGLAKQILYSIFPLNTHRIIKSTSLLSLCVGLFCFPFPRLPTLKSRELPA